MSGKWVAKGGWCLQLEESVRDLQHQHVWMVVFVADQHAFAGASHAIFLVVLLQPLQSRDHRGIFLGLGFFRAEGVVT